MNKLTKNIFYNSSYQLLIIIIPLITTPYLTRTLGRDALGIDSYVLSIVSLCQILGSLGTNMYANREIAYVRNDRDKMIRTFWEIFLIRTALCIAVCLGYLFLSARSAYRTVFLVYTVTLVSYFMDVSWFFTGLEEMRPVVIKNTCIKILVTAAIFLFIRKPEDLYLYIAINAAGQALGALLIFVQCRGLIRFVRPDRLSFRRHLLPIIGLFLPQAASSINVMFDKTMLGMLVSDISKVSIYDKAQILVKTPIVFATALTAALLPRIANEYVAGNTEKVKEHVNNSLEFTIALFLPLTVGMMMLSPAFIPWYLGKDFTGSVAVAQILAPIIFFIALSNVSGSQFLVASNNTKYLSISYMASAAINIVGNYLLIPKYEEAGASYTTVAAEAAVVIIQFTAMYRLVGKMNMIRISYKKCIACLAMGLTVFALGRLQGGIRTILLQVFAGAVVYAAVLWILRDRVFLSARDMLMKILKRKS